MGETNPNLNIPGAKDDSEKILAAVLGDFSSALREVAAIGTYGAKKYTRNGWESVEDARTRYLDALWRHLLAMENNLEAVDPEHGYSHLGAVAWNTLALLEIMHRGLSE